MFAISKQGGISERRLDNVAELTSYLSTELTEYCGVESHLIPHYKLNQNALIERFNKSFRGLVIDANLFNTLPEVQSLDEEWLTDYTECRPYASLGDLPPTVFKSIFSKAKISTLELSP